MKTLMLFSILLFLNADAMNLEETPESFVLELKQLHIPGYPNAFNPSIIRWQGRLLLSFRNISNHKDPYNSSQIGLIWLDENFNAIAEPQILIICENDSKKCKRAEDARLIEVDDHLYMVYSNNEEDVLAKGNFRVFVAELKEENSLFYLSSKDRLSQYEGETQNLREKNWTPFNYQKNLFLSYSLNPHLVFKPIIGNEICETICSTYKDLPNWQWGELRGGTQSLLIDGRYLTLFHTAIRMSSIESGGKDMLHYFMGAATYNSEPPFEMTAISKAPIIGKGFFSGKIYPPFFGSWRGIFPGGFVFDNNYIYVVYGRQNYELWMVKLDKKELLTSLSATQ